MKKIISTFIVIAMFCMLFCVSAQAEEITGTPEETTVKENTEALTENAIEIITNSTFISTLATIFTGVGAVIVFIARFAKSIRISIKDKADSKTMVDTINKGIGEIDDKFKSTINELNAKLENVEKALENEKDNSKQLSIILSSFILHTNIGNSAKAEILKYINGLKEYSGTTIEIIDSLENAIKIAESEEEKIETPALDQVCAISLE